MGATEYRGIGRLCVLFLDLRPRFRNELRRATVIHGVSFFLADTKRHGLAGSGVP